MPQRILAGLLLSALLGVLPLGTARADDASFVDPPGDQRETDGGDGYLGGADLVALTVEHGASELVLGVQLTDAPSTEYRTSGLLSVRWLLEFDATQPGPDAEISIFTLGSSVLESAHRRVGDEEKPCEVVGLLDGTSAGARGIPVGCAGEGGPIRVAVEVHYRDPDDGDHVEVDYLPDRPDGTVVYGEAVPRTERTGPRPVRRVAGEDRFGTAVAVTRAQIPAGNDSRPLSRVFLARADDFADALAANGSKPKLLVPSCGPLPEVVGEELARLAPRRVVALGGAAAICDGVLAEAAAAAGGAETERLAGATRYETAVQIGIATAPIPECDDSDCPPVGEGYLARADDFADALSSAPLKAGPLLLVPRCGPVPRAILEAVGSSRLYVRDLVALGGQQAVCDDVVDQVEGAIRAYASEDEVTTRRIAGADRIETALAISRSRFPTGALDLALATAADFPDALTGGTLVDGPVLLTPGRCELPGAVRDEIVRLNPETITVLGGEQAVCEGVAIAAAG